MSSAPRRTPSSSYASLPVCLVAIRPSRVPIGTLATRPSDRAAAGRRLGPMSTISIIDVTDARGFGRVPPCADPGFDHRSCDYWENAEHGSKAARLGWLEPAAAAEKTPVRKAPPANPFLADLEAARPAANPFAAAKPANPFLTPGEDDDDTPIDNPFAPRPAARPSVGSDAPRKLQLLGRGLGVAGSYAKVLLRDDVPAVYAQFGPLTAYPRAQRTRDLYPSLPDAPLPAVITCIATTAEARGAGLARALIAAVCEDLTGAGLHRGRDVPGDRRGPGRHERRDPRVLGVGRLRARDRGRALPGHAPRPGLTSTLTAMTEAMSSVGARPVRAPRGSELTCRGWGQEAALRMLMNNLDPEVAEDPDHLVVYGGTGRAARSWPAFDAIVRELRALGDDETLLIQSGKPVGVLRTHPWAPRVLIANSNLVGKWATWDVLPGPRASGPDDVRADDRRLLDLHRDPGHPPGHLRDVRRGGPPALRRDPPRDRDPDRGAGRDGRRPAAGGDHERRRGHRHRGRRGARPAAARHRLRRPPDGRPGRGARLGTDRGRGRRGGQHRAGRQRRRDRAGLGGRRRAVRHRHRPDLRP